MGWQIVSMAEILNEGETITGGIRIRDILYHAEFIWLTARRDCFFVKNTQ